MPIPTGYSYMSHALKVHEVADDSDWRRQRYTTHDFLAFLLSHGKGVSPIFSVYGVFTYLFRIDWLHAVDLGVGADFLGNLFSLLEKKMPGRSKTVRSQHIWLECVEYYETHGVQDTVKSLDYQPSKATVPPKLRCNAAGCRALIRFGHEMAQKYLSDGDPIEQGAKLAAMHLWQCYQSLSQTGAMYKKEVFDQSSKAFALQYHALFLAVGDGVSWRVKPKMHLFLELCCEDTEPNLFWCYRDEDFGGSVAKQCKMRGSWKKLSAFSLHGLHMFCMKNDPPRLV
jgi:hypothetical protein